MKTVSMAENDAANANGVQMRSSVRFPIHLPVEVKAAEGAHHATTSNISSGGVLFVVDAEINVGTKIEFTIAMPAAVLGTGKDVLVNCVGRVVRVGAEGERRAVAAIIDEYQITHP